MTYTENRVERPIVGATVKLNVVWGLNNTQEFVTKSGPGGRCIITFTINPPPRDDKAYYVWHYEKASSDPVKIKVVK